MFGEAAALFYCDTGCFDLDCVKTNASDSVRKVPVSNLSRNTVSPV
jgi:hypothetical protein